MDTEGVCVMNWEIGIDIYTLLYIKWITNKNLLYKKINKIQKNKITNIFYLFIYFCLLWVFIAAHRLSLVAASRGYSSLQCTGLYCGGFSYCRARALGMRASVVVAHGL